MLTYSKYIFESKANKNQRESIFYKYNYTDIYTQSIQSEILNLIDSISL